jgi:hypothetical protein
MGGGYYDRACEPAPAPGNVEESHSTYPYSAKADLILGRITEIHEDLKPTKNLSTDSGSPVVICCDVTGSMGSWPKVIWDKLPMMYGQTLTQGYLSDPTFCFAACGDAYGDKSPLQIGDFAAGSDIDDWISKIFVEGGGGGGVGSRVNHETYELGAYYFSRHCELTNAEAPIFFFIGDEAFYDNIEKKVVASLMQDNLDADLNSLDVFAELKRKFKGNVFLIHRTHPSADAMVVAKWKAALGANRVLPLDNPKAGVDCMLGVMAIISGARSLAEYTVDMANRGQDQARISDVANALSVLSLDPSTVGAEKRDDRKIVGSMQVTTFTEQPITINVVEHMTWTDLESAVELEIGLSVEKQFFPTLSGRPLPESLPASTPLQVVLAKLPSSVSLLKFDLMWGYPSSGKDFLDGTCFVFRKDASLSLITTLDFKSNKWKNGALTHSGDVMDEKKLLGHHLITVDFNKLRNVQSVSDQPWACPSCTFENQGSDRVCQVCGARHVGDSHELAKTAEPDIPMSEHLFIFAMSACKQVSLFIN